MRKLFLSLPLLLALPAQAAGEFYCCHDPNNGRRICGDTMPPICRGQAYRVMDSAGNVIKEVGPPLTPEQKAEQILENRRRKQLEEAGREQRRRDQALLDTYTMAEDIDLAQKKAEADVNLAIQATQSRINEARNKRKKLEDEAEFYKKRTLPATLDRDLKALAHEIKLQEDLLEIKKRDFDSIKTKYDADRKRYFELTRRPAAAPDTSSGNATTRR